VLRFKLIIEKDNKYQCIIVSGHCMKSCFTYIFNYSLLSFILFFIGIGCAGKAEKLSYHVPESSKTSLRSMDYTIQVGAYSNLTNAVNVNKKLEKQGLDAYYFRDKNGLYKVRFGNYISKKDAEYAAKKLISQNIIDSYYIVRPEEYATNRSRDYTPDDLRRDIVRTAEDFIGIPYRWGGDTPDEGFDCSGLAMAVYQMNGLNLPRSTRDQFDSGRPTSRGNLRRGDLVFFKISRGRKVSHVGIYRGDGRFIHAPGKGKTIRVDSFSNSYFKKRYAGGRSYIK
jgi:cell wall-associated NlpC family hydrolase